MKNLIIIATLTLLSTQFCFGQITFGEIAQIDQRIVSKPAQYDSLKNFEYHEALKDNKRYIGLEVYLPPIQQEKIGVYSRRGDELFLFSSKIKKIKTNIVSNRARNRVLEARGIIHKKTPYDSLMTYIYKPYHYFSLTGSNISVYPDSAEVSNTYYTILDVIYEDRSRSIMDEIFNNMQHLKDSLNNTNIVLHSLPVKYLDIASQPLVLFLLKNNRNNDSLYTTVGSLYSNFILVPYFVKQKELYEGKTLIYDDRDSKYDRSNYESSFQAIDKRYIIRYEDDNGNEKTGKKMVTVQPGSKWVCKEVTLLQATNNYDIHYVLENDKGEQIALDDNLDPSSFRHPIDRFIKASDYTKREADKKLQRQALLAKKEKEATLMRERERLLQEQRRQDMVNLFGENIGRLVAEGKVQINMTQEMCKQSWGKPIRINKTTTEQGTTEYWEYNRGYRLFFVNGLLKQIDE